MLTPNMSSYVKKHEGCKLTLYNDQYKNVTIGWGTNLKYGISQHEADMLFLSRAQIALQDAILIFPNFDSFSETRQAVLFDMTYQLGKPDLLEFRRFIVAVNQQNWSQAEIELLDSAYAYQVPSRANENAHFLLKGTWD